MWGVELLKFFYIKLDLKHNIFINDANEAIKNNQNDTRFVETDDGSHFIDLQSPIIIAQK